MKSPRDMGGEELRSVAKAADRRLGAEIDRLAARDQKFREALSRALELESEIERRKNR